MVVQCKISSPRTNKEPNLLVRFGTVLVRVPKSYQKRTNPVKYNVFMVFQCQPQKSLVRFWYGFGTGVVSGSTTLFHFDVFVVFDVADCAQLCLHLSVCVTGQ